MEQYAESEAVYTEGQVIEYGKSQFEKALFLAMEVAKKYGTTGNLIAVEIGMIERDDK